jgi:single-stranded DNA-binding protein
MELKANIIVVEGKVGSDPIITYSKDGLPTTKFTVLNGDKSFDVKTGGKLAEICSIYLCKNNKIILSGRIRRGGNTITAYDIKLLPQKK